MNPNTVDVPSILRDGAYYILDQFALRDEMYAKVVAAFLDGVEALESLESRRALEAAGLRKLHEHFPVAKVRLLEDFLMKRLREELYYWSFAVGHHTLGLPHPFYVDYLIVERIHYPFLVAKAGREIAEPPFPFREKLRLAGASLRNLPMLANRLGVGLRKRRAQRQKLVAYDPVAYHGKLPTPARSHGPHVDTWYGHSYDGINLWWSIDGVNRDNTVILYPDMFGLPLEYDPKSMYLAAGVPVSKPHHVDIRPGQLLIFNSEMLHGTQVNISNDTRIVLTTRLNPGQPRFNDDAPFNFEYWYSIDRSGTTTIWQIESIPLVQSSGGSRQSRRTSRSRTLGRSERLFPNASAPKPRSRSAAFRISEPGKKFAVDLENAKLLLWKTDGGVPGVPAPVPAPRHRPRRRLS